MVGVDGRRRAGTVLVLAGSLVVAVPGLVLLAIGVCIGVGGSVAAGPGDWLQALLLVLGGPLAGLAAAGLLLRTPRVRRLDPLERAALVAFCLFCGTLTEGLLLAAGAEPVPPLY
ncbi:hypothetical protein [Kitasatospora sp. DSM 101779]|uniref:hypothetical protein n=1 Tax=Kitasatospora sp. DSM 101779 TaxID=2853165 RepID=UPI0021D8C150|nr:hypothetical protein [Kitasatospora sp. DSM 101779]MCU7822306.1 hypothetical protein [Kitasatospora sp. DSM 101779]